MLEALTRNGATATCCAHRFRRRSLEVAIAARRGGAIRVQQNPGHVRCPSPSQGKGVLDDFATNLPSPPRDVPGATRDRRRVLAPARASGGPGAYVHWS